MGEATFLESPSNMGFLYITIPGFTFSLLMCDISQSSSGFPISVRLKAMCMAYGRACDVLRTRLPLILRDTTFSSRLSIAKLQDVNKALNRLTKSKEAALLDAERTVQKLLWEKKKKILDRMHRQKVAKVVKLTQTVRELEEAVHAGGAAANAIQDFHKG
ncbi:Microtubule-associated protein 70-1 [Capsicum chinense]|nr:Microtubule-associated protein 70-1 [Capsicum chinense]